MGYCWKYKDDGDRPHAAAYGKVNNALHQMGELSSSNVNFSQYSSNYLTE